MPYAAMLVQSLRRLITPIVAPWLDRRSARRVVESPVEFEQRLAASIDAAFAYFESQAHWSMGPLFLLGTAWQKEVDPRLCLVEAPLGRYRAEHNDPSLRLLDGRYDPNDSSRRALPQVDVAHPVESLMVQCLYADREGSGEDLLKALRAIDDGGGYGTTHMIWGAQLLERYGGVDSELTEPVIERALPSLIAAQRVSETGDLYAERIVFLQWAGRGDAVDPAWIDRLVQAQNTDGGWTRGPTLRRAAASQHSSALALVALLQFCLERSESRVDDRSK